MKKFQLILLSAIILGVVSCGAGNDAKDVCNCYEEGIKLAGDESEKKLTQCLELLNKYIKKHEEAGTLEGFMEEYNKCR